MIARWAAAVSLVVALTASGVLTPQQERGKQLYLTGESTAKRPVTALLGADAVEVAASVVPCANCHGRDGRGRVEGGVRPPNLQWDVLTRVLTTDDRSRPAYTRSQVKRAITMGLDSGAKPLESTMPRYRMALEDIEDLLAYLEVLSSDRDPGLTDEAIRIGAVLPAGTEEQRAVRATLEKYFERVNRDGGIFGRRIDPRFTSTSGTPEQRAAALASFIESEQPFAIGAAWLSGADLAMSAIAEKARVPTIAAFSADAPPDDRVVFRLLAGTREQSLALVAAAKPDPNARIAIIADDATSSMASRIRDDLRTAKYTRVEIATTIPAGTELVLFTGVPSALRAILEQAAAAPVPPHVLIPAAHSSGDVVSAPAALDGRILVALPSSPDDITEEGAAELRALDVPATHATSCRLALAAARLTIDAIRRAGRDLDRDTLVSTLETLYNAPTHLTPPITWSASQHTGTRKVRILAIDLREKRWADRGWWTGPV
ncbi:MAG TPA: ABC transporter substrate-binding protein [Thermoanaerobaculia bacterium]|nr:ABC transporter substrate-binding protein [Thermoanaerobaculia bacterium]